MAIDGLSFAWTTAAGVDHVGTNNYNLSREVGQSAADHAADGDHQKIELMQLVRGTV
jgi:hypothetical protein